MVFGRIHCIARGLECPFYFGKKDKQKTGIGCSPIPVSIDPQSARTKQKTTRCAGGQ